MAIRINLKSEVDNTSLQINDAAYYVKDDDTTTSITSFTDSIKLIGVITEIGNDYIIVDSGVLPPDDAFIMFSKNKIANNTSLLGYYAEVELSNNSTKKAELFSLSSEVAPSSK
jgi:hypothetical protein